MSTTWDAGRRLAATPSKGRVTGVPAAGGALLRIEIYFELVEWPGWKKEPPQPLSLLPQAADVTAYLQRGTLPLGQAIVAQEQVVAPGAHAASTTVHYICQVSMLAMAALEAARDGGNITLELGLPAIAVIPDSHERLGRPWAKFSLPVPQQDWIGVLKNIGFCDTLITELRLPTTGPESTAKGRDRLKAAVNDRNNGSYAETMRKCRLALDELKQAGFGGKAPSEVAQFLQEKSGTMTLPERYSALQVALKLFLSQAHHAHLPDEEYSREDAELAIAMAAALLKMAPRWDGGTS